MPRLISFSCEFLSLVCMCYYVGRKFEIRNTISSENKLTVTSLFVSIFINRETLLDYKKGALNDIHHKAQNVNILPSRRFT